MYHLSICVAYGMQFGGGIARFFLCLFVHFPIMQVCAHFTSLFREMIRFNHIMRFRIHIFRQVNSFLHAKFAAVVANLRAEKATAFGNDVLIEQARADEADRNARGYLDWVTGGNSEPHLVADFESQRRRAWCIELGLSTDLASLGDWKPSSLPPTHAASKIHSPVFQSASHLMHFVCGCLASEPRALYFKWTMWVFLV